MQQDKNNVGFDDILEFCGERGLLWHHLGDIYKVCRTRHDMQYAKPGKNYLIYKGDQTRDSFASIYFGKDDLWHGMRYGRNKGPYPSALQVFAHLTNPRLWQEDAPTAQTIKPRERYYWNVDRVATTASRVYTVDGRDYYFGGTSSTSSAYGRANKATYQRTVAWRNVGDG